MNTKFCISISLLVLVTGLKLVAAKKAKEGYKGSWLHCDETGIGFHLEMNVLTKTFLCATPHMKNISAIKNWSVDAIETTQPDLISKLVHCLIRRMKFLDGKTGKVKEDAPNELKAVFKQQNIQDLFVEVANQCYKDHNGDMSKDAKSFKGYIKCFENSKLNSTCPNHQIKPGNAFDISKFKSFG